MVFHSVYGATNQYPGVINFGLYLVTFQRGARMSGL